MRIFTALAALLCAGLATGPARASSTTIIDFTIEVKGIFFSGSDVDPLFAGKDAGDRFDATLTISNPPMNVSPREDRGLFLPESLVIEGFDPVFFIDPAIETVPFFGAGSLYAELRTQTKLTGLTMSSNFTSLGLDADNFVVSDILTLLTGTTSNSLFAIGIENLSFTDTSGISFDVTTTSIRPDTTPIPLPAAGWLMVAGIGGLAALRRR